MFRSHGLARVLGALAVAVLATAPNASSEATSSALKHDPRAAQRNAAAKRAPAGTAVPSDRYIAAEAHMAGMSSYSTAAPSLDSTATVVGTWQNLGPSNYGGRTRALIVQSGSPNTWFAAGVAGGVFKTIDAGANWTPLSDTATPLVNLAVTALVQKTGTPLTILAGTGESFDGVDAVRGAGIFQSTNGGTTWTHITATNSATFGYYVNDLVWGTGNNVYVATSVGIFRSNNSGTTWVKILDPLINGGCLDLAYLGGATDTLLASCGTGVQAKIYRTTVGTTAVDAGSWPTVFSETDMGRTSLSTPIAAAPNTVYALSANLSTDVLHAVFRSTDGGINWVKQLDGVSGPANSRLILQNAKAKLCSPLIDEGAGGYANTIAIDPSDPSGNTVWSGSIDVFRSVDAGATWAPMSSWSQDGQPQFLPSGQHALVFGASSMLVAGDGGIYRMTGAPSGQGSFAACPGGGTVSTATFTPFNNGYAVTQFYSGAVAPNDTTYVGGAQRFTLRGTDAGGVAGFTRIRNEFGGAAVIDPSDPNVIYVVGEQGAVRKSLNGGSTFPNHPTFPGGNWADGLSGTFNDQAAFAMDPTDSNRLWIASDRIFRSDDGAGLWTAASDVLASTATAIAVSPANPEVVLVGTSGGQIYRTTAASSGTGSTVWASIAPRVGYVSSLAFDPVNSQIAYATYSTFGGVHLWKTINGGASWLDADGAGATGIPDVPVHSVIVEPTNTATPSVARLYAGTDAGVFVSLNSGTAWAKENTGFLNVNTEALAVSGANLYAFTHGRGVWRVGLTTASPTTTVGFFAPRTTETENLPFPSVDVVLSTANHTPLTADVTVAYASANGTAVSGGDYSAVSGTLTFPSGSAHGTTLQIPVSIVDDGIGEPTETFALNLSAPTGAVLARASHTVAIEDNGDPAGFSVNDVTVAESAVSPNVVFTVSLYPAPTGTVTVNYTTVNGTAIAPGDYTAQSGVLTFLAGNTSKTVTVLKLNDTLAEMAETFSLVLSGSSGPTIADNTGVATITDDDVSGTLQFSAATYTTTEVGISGKATITVTRTGGSASGVSVQYATSNGSAVAPGDYTAATGTLTFASGVTSQTFQITLVNDALDENDETVLLSLFNPLGLGAELGLQSTSTLTITDNDTAGELAFSAAAYTGVEGTTLTVTVKRTGGTNPTSGVSVNYATSNVTAVAPGDYAAASGILTFTASEIQKTFTIALVAEAPPLVDEGETFQITLSGPTGGGVLGAVSTTTVTIGDASPKVSFSVASASAAETLTTLALTVQRTGPTTSALNVPYFTTDGTAKSTAVGSNPADFTAVPAGNLLIPAGVTSKTISIVLKPDTVVEGPESFTVTIQAPAGGILGTNPTVTVNVTDNDFGGEFVFSLATFNGTEPLSGVLPAKATVTVKRTGGTASGVTVAWSTSDGTALAPGDYTTASNVLTFDSGILSKTFTVDVLPDADSEGYETINLALATPTGGASLGVQSTATITIIDSEPVVLFSVNAISAGEATPKVTITVKRTGTLAGALTVGIADLGTGTATLGAGNDYNNVPGSLVLPVNAATKTFTVDILQDTALESIPETINLALTSCTPACQVAPTALSTAVVSIVDDEPLVSFSVTPYAVTEGTAKVTLTLKRTNSLVAALTVSLNVTGGTASGAGVDYNNVPATVLIPANAATKTFTIDIVNDLIAEPTENIELQITGVTASTGAAYLGTLITTMVNIADNEPSIGFLLPSAFITEPLNTTTLPTKHTVAVKRTGTLTQVSTVQYAIVGGTATIVDDFNPFTPPTATGTLTFASGVSTVNIVVDIVADLVDEAANETFTITLSNPTAARLGANTIATRSITDNDI